ncbi:potassium channel subfamily U member 1 [Erinaceus europaeus]|uniref:Potassium channel subfamily U member 1 n=1 Tax=Erinaceus europaeus TaxID=9365 RepID=A0ABM3WQ95_ERIEU|nr:potassium channel subfamily U member 1 [Erinaceus europaeus]
MYRVKTKNGSEEELEKIYCTFEVQAAFILSSVVTFVAGLLILLFFRVTCRAIRKWRRLKGTGVFLGKIFPDGTRDNHLDHLHFRGIFRDQIEMLLSAQTFVGRVLVILVFVLSIGSLIIYFVNSIHPVRTCSSFEDITIVIDLIFNSFFSFYFGLRFVAADDKIKFWLEMNSIVDIFTIPPTFISFYLKSNWLGLRFLRALRLLELPRILQLLRAIKSSNTVKFSKLLSIIISTWLTAAGFIHLVENSGDPWLRGRNSQNISYFDSIYLVMATTSTVGFGDVVAKTSLGRTFIMLFTLGSLVLFANFIPEMIELFANKRRYTQDYEIVKGKKFIVVCGNITVESVTAFLRNFLRRKKGEINTEIVFLGESLPSLELETLFKCYLAYTTFVFGSALKWEDLKRVAMEYAEACLILANPLCSDSHAEDTSNIMRVLSIKNYYPETRIIIQILQSHNKGFLPKIPSWSWATGDNIICFNELKLGFIAQGCLVPGLCTLLTSLFVEQYKKVPHKYTWQKDFSSGLQNKILTQRLSDDFAGMSFPEVSRLCFVKMHIMLIAIEHKSAFHGYRGLILNPPAQVKLRKNTLGFFIAESANVVRRAFFYCNHCHRDVHSPEMIEKCSCRTKSHLHHFPVLEAKLLRSNVKKASSTSLDFKKDQSSLLSSVNVVNRSNIGETDHDSDMFDSSGMFHWCKTTPLDKVILKRTEMAKHEFRDHIVACVFEDAHSPLLGLQNFVMPLRASNYTRAELKDIVFLGSLDYLQREWRFLRNFPQIYILSGSALYSGDLHVVNVEECAMCVVLSSPSNVSSGPALADTENIMATLNVGSLRISPHAPTLSETHGLSVSSSTRADKQRDRRIPILTELKNPSNIHFIEQLSGMEGHLAGMNLHLSTSFATGTVFSDTFLDSLLATAFYNYHVLELLHMLVTGGISSQMQQHLDKEKGNELTDSGHTLLSGRMRCKLGLLSLKGTILSDVPVKDTFGQLFCGSLDMFGCLCLGLYRMIDEEKQNPEHKRGVCYRPPNDFVLIATDLVFCAIPADIAYYKKTSYIDEHPHENIHIPPKATETVIDLRSPTAESTTETEDFKTEIHETSTETIGPLIHSRSLKSMSPSEDRPLLLIQSSSLSSQTYISETETEN